MNRLLIIINSLLSLGVRVNGILNDGEYMNISSHKTLRDFNLCISEDEIEVVFFGEAIQDLSSDDLEIVSSGDNNQNLFMFIDTPSGWTESTSEMRMPFSHLTISWRKEIVS